MAHLMSRLHCCLQRLAEMLAESRKVAASRTLPTFHPALAQALLLEPMVTEGPKRSCQLVSRAAAGVCEGGGGGMCPQLPARIQGCGR